eukprot:tig00000079_g2794.t1
MAFCFAATALAARAAAPQVESTSSAAVCRRKEHPIARRRYTLNASAARAFFAGHVRCLSSPHQAPAVNFALSPVCQLQGAVAAETAQLSALEGNAWILEAGGLRVYVDPWLTGDLSFGLDAFYVGKKRFVGDVLADAQPGGSRAADLILITQGLPDHCHGPTLKLLDKSIPVVASPTAAAACRALGFKDVTALAPGETRTFGALELRATAGAVVGPPWQAPENGFLLRVSGPTPLSLYYEPHGEYPEGALDGIGPVDVVVTPVIAVSILDGLPLVRGTPEATALVRRLRPRTVVPLLNFSLEQAGVLPALLRSAGSVEGFQEALRAEGLPARVAVPTPNVPLPLP